MFSSLQMGKSSSTDAGKPAPRAPGDFFTWCSLCTCIFRFFKARMGKNKNTSPVHSAILEQFCCARGKTCVSSPDTCSTHFNFCYSLSLAVVGGPRKPWGPWLSALTWLLTRRPPGAVFRGVFPCRIGPPFQDQDQSRRLENAAEWVRTSCFSSPMCPFQGVSHGLLQSVSHKVGGWQGEGRFCSSESGNSETRESGQCRLAGPAGF